MQCGPNRSIPFNCSGNHCERFRIDDLLGWCIHKDSFHIIYIHYILHISMTPHKWRGWDRISFRWNREMETADVFFCTKNSAVSLRIAEDVNMKVACSFHGFPWYGSNTSALTSDGTSLILCQWVVEWCNINWLLVLEWSVSTQQPDSQ